MILTAAQMHCLKLKCNQFPSLNILVYVSLSLGVQIVNMVYKVPAYLKPPLPSLPDVHGALTGPKYLYTCDPFSFHLFHPHALAHAVPGVRNAFPCLEMVGSYFYT